MKEGKSSDCLNSSSIDKGKLDSCIREDGRGLAYAEQDFELANKIGITGSPTLMLNGKIASEFDFATNTTNGRSPEALKELLCCAFNTKPSFCSQELNGTRAMTMYSVQTKTAAATTQQAPGRDIILTKLGEKSPSQAMLITDNTMNSAISRYPLLVAEAFVDWCGYCKNLNVTVSELSSELQGQVAFGLIDMGKNNATKTKYNISSYPTMLIFKDGKLVNQIAGNEQKSSIIAKLKKIEPNLNTSKVRIVQTAQTPPKPKLTPEQVCVNMTKYDKPLLEVFVVSNVPLGCRCKGLWQI
jgi:thioredoxin 1